MQYYSAKVRLSGSPLNEVRDVFSAPEILIMQYVHGVDAVVELKPVRQEKINMNEFKQFLKGKYDQALVKREQSIDKIFGALGQLPVKLPDNLLEMHGLIDEDDVIAVAKDATKADKNRYLPQNDLEQRRLETLVPANEIDMSSLME